MQMIGQNTGFSIEPEFAQAIASGKVKVRVGMPVPTTRGWCLVRSISAILDANGNQKINLIPTEAALAQLEEGEALMLGFLDLTDQAGMDAHLNKMVDHLIATGALTPEVLADRLEARDRALAAERDIEHG